MCYIFLQNVEIFSLQIHIMALLLLDWTNTSSSTFFDLYKKWDLVIFPLNTEGRAPDSVDSSNMIEVSGKNGIIAVDKLKEAYVFNQKTMGVA